MKCIFRPGIICVGALVLLSAGCSRDVTAERTAAVAASPADTPKAADDSKPPAVVDARSDAAAAVASGDPTIASGATVSAEPAYRDVTIPAGTRVLVRLESGVSSKTSQVEDRVNGTVTVPVRVGQMLALPEGSRVRGDVVTAEPAGKVKGRAQVALRFRTLTIGRESYPIVAQISRLAPQTKKEDAEKIALPAVGGAIVGAIVGGKKGAAIGAAAGGGAGTAVVLATPGKEVSIPSGSIVTLRLQQPVTVRVKT